MKKLNLNQKKFVGAEVLSRAELKKVMGGTTESCGLPGQFCSIGNECCAGLSCSHGICSAGELTCTIVAKTSPPDCGNGASITFPAGTTLQQAQAWCSAQPCCASISC